ncbi:MAG: hypothetical protein WBH44_08725, partial [Proteocatella sp.]
KRNNEHYNKQYENITSTLMNAGYIRTYNLIIFFVSLTRDVSIGLLFFALKEFASSETIKIY